VFGKESSIILEYQNCSKQKAEASGLTLKGK